MLRPATAADARLLFTWANDPATRAQSFSTGPIAWESHVAWFERVLADPARVLWLLEDDGRPVASIRFEARGGAGEPGDADAVVSVQAAPDARGRGYGRRVVAEATALYVSATARRVVAEIRPSNTASARVFEAAGYVLVDDGDPLRYATTTAPEPPVTTT
ncbi:GNAT family N-acetyltransferase [Cellulomonas cellasea]|uniref:RimJ/RimL family protein N-acetyltransferase n=1 Tax=Cellulomonas cellasea TaxID=43670 RepID=A0A7W4UHB1_9CELL|nr:GNAT family N-acetyltransferase [Cellulomonas cellasea]MBB2924152.1 RimJ/RimL family protein N-acetyltransferase [Cellulomonas cellasea]